MQKQFGLALAERKEKGTRLEGLIISGSEQLHSPRTQRRRRPITDFKPQKGRSCLSRKEGEGTGDLIADDENENGSKLLHE